MPFSLTSEQETFREEMQAFAASEITPKAIAIDQAEAYPDEILSKLGERRLTGLTLPDEYGGRDAGYVELAIMIEELAAALMSVASSLALHLGVATVIERFGTDAQRDAYLPDMATYETVGALGLSERNAGSNKLEMETTATEDGEGWVLSGHKRWVTNFQHADLVLTYAKTGPDAEAPRNISAFLIPVEAFERERVWDTLGANSSKAVEVTLSDVHVSDTQRVGTVHEAYIERGALATGVNLPARGVGIARAALADTVAYTAEREQYDQCIGDFQGVRWMVAEMAARVDAARLLTLRAAARADRGLDVRRELSMAKINATEAAVENANDAIQLHGGVGYTTEHHVERYLRDARLLTLAGGPNEGHRDRVAAALYDKGSSGK